MRQLALLIVGLVVLATGATGSMMYVRSRAERSQPTCEDQPPAGNSDVVSFGPIAFDPGLNLTNGSDLRWVGTAGKGKIVKAFLVVDRADAIDWVRISGTGLNQKASLLFDYHGEGYGEAAELSRSDLDRATRQPSTARTWGVPGALLAPELDVYRVTVETNTGSWQKQIWICSAAAQAGSPGEQRSA